MCHVPERNKFANKGSTIMKIVLKCYKASKSEKVIFGGNVGILWVKVSQKLYVLGLDFNVEIQ